MTCNVRVGDQLRHPCRRKCRSSTTAGGFADFCLGSLRFGRAPKAPTAFAPCRLAAGATATPPRVRAAAGAARCTQCLRRGRAEAAQGTCVKGRAEERAGMAGRPPAAGLGGADLSRSVSAFELDRCARGEARRGLVIGLATRAATSAPGVTPAACGAGLSSSSATWCRPAATPSCMWANITMRCLALSLAGTRRGTTSARRGSAWRAAWAPVAPGRALGRKRSPTAAEPQPGCRKAERGERGSLERLARSAPTHVHASRPAPPARPRGRRAQR